MKNERIIWIDNAKGLGIILVIVLHLTSGTVNYMISSFIMPLFFFLSGYVESGSGLKFGTFLCKEVKTRIAPYFLLASILILFSTLYNKWDSITIGLTIKNVLIQKRSWTIWFLACLVCVEILFWIFNHVFHDIKVIVGISFVLFIFGYIYYFYGGTPLFWNFDVAFMALSFYSMGKMCYYKYIHGINSFTICIIIWLLCFWSNYLFTGQTLDMGGSMYGLFPITFIGAMFGINSIVILAKNMESRILAYIGKNSLLIFALHNVIYRVLVNDILKKFNIDFAMTGIMILLKGILILIMALFISYLVNKSKSIISKLYNKGRIMQ